MAVDFEMQMNRQLRYLRRSAATYDRGAKDEAIRLATQLRVLFHHTYNPQNRRGSTSLMEHLGASSVMLLSTCEYMPAGTRFWPNLVKIELNPFGQRLECIPKLHEARTNRLLDFFLWWKIEVVFVSEHLRFTRERLVTIAANQDGGAHVDANLDVAYQELEAGAGFSMTVNPDNGPSRTISLANAHLATLRQITFEVLHSEQLLRLQGSFYRPGPFGVWG